MPDPRVCQDNKSISPVIRVNGLSKSFDKVVALSDINLEVYPGEIFGLLGPNGSGKTTLLKILLGLSFPTKGEAFVLNKPCSDIGVKSQIGFLPDMPQYYPFLSPLECLDFYSSLFNLPKNERKKNIEELLNLVGLYADRKRRLVEFSKGMLQRIGLAVSLLNDPELLLLDEPTIGLDPIGSLQIRDLLLKLKAQGKTILLCSHLLSEVEYACDKIAILHNGKLIKTGELSELLKKKDEIQINIKSKGAEIVQKIIQLLNRENIKDVSVDNPRQSLEGFFYKVIREAKDAP